MANNSKYVGVDFDGTCVTHDYPNVGTEIGAVPVLKRLVEAGHKLIINTMRSEKELQDAVDWFQKNQLPVFGVNSNPTQSSWTKSSKVYAHLYIDDAALGCPLIFNPEISPRPFVDWVKVGKELENLGFISKINIIDQYNITTIDNDTFRDIIQECAFHPQVRKFLIGLDWKHLARAHHNVGQYVRNRYKLWSYKWEPDYQPYKGTAEVDMSPNHPDNISGRIIEQIWLNIKHLEGYDISIHGVII